MLIRINAPGQPITFIDLGHARGRSSSSPFQSMGGPIVVVTPKAKPDVRLNRIIARDPGYVDRIGRHPHPQYESCGHVMRYVGERCARRKDHKREHRSKEAMVAAAARRRRNYFGDEG